MCDNLALASNFVQLTASQWSFSRAWWSKWFRCQFGQFSCWFTQLIGADCRTYLWRKRQNGLVGITKCERCIKHTVQSERYTISIPIYVPDRILLVKGPYLVYCILFTALSLNVYGLVHKCVYWSYTFRYWPYIFASGPYTLLRTYGS